MAEEIRKFCDVVFLEEADGGDARRSGFEARVNVCERDATKGQHWDV